MDKLRVIIAALVLFLCCGMSGAVAVGIAVFVATAFSLLTIRSPC